jgi:hypothetical protein
MDDFEMSGYDFIPSINVYFCITANEFDLDEVTRKIGVIPTKTRTKSNFPPQGLACTGWVLETGHENCLAVDIQFKKILKMLEGKANIIKTVCGEYNLEASFTVSIHMMHGERPEMVLPREVISFAAAINAEIGFDLYCYEEDYPECPPLKRRN